MTTLSATEQLHLEMINRARLDPIAEAQRVGLPSLNEFIDNGTVLTGVSKQPLAANDALSAVAENHALKIVSSHVMDHGQSNDGHGGAGDGTPETRMRAAGFTPATWQENFALSGTTATLTDEIIAQMTAGMHDGLFFDDPDKMFGIKGGHRITMLQEDIKEIGIGQTTGSWMAKLKDGSIRQLNGTFVVENFAQTPANKSFLSGVVYDDTGNNFYDIGEARSNVTATVFDSAGNRVNSDVTGSGGGWTVAENFGNFTVTFSGGSLPSSVSAMVEAGTLNAKVDLVNGKDIYSSVSTTLGSGAVGLRLLGINDINGTGNGSSNTIVGNKGANVLEGRGGDDNIDGGAGSDTAVFRGAQANYKIELLAGGTSARITDMVGNEGSDVISNIEKVNFGGNIVGFSTLTNSSGAVNHAPVVKAKSVSVNTHDDMSLSSMFTATDQQGNGTITKYGFMDSDTATGKIIFKGVAQESGKWFFVDAEDLALVKYEAGASVDSEKISVKAFDGKVWSDVVDVTAKTTARAGEDFGANGNSDLLFHNEKTGALHMRQLNGSSITFEKQIEGKTLNWDVAGIGDFGGDGKADILWHSENGSVQLWQMNGTTRVSSTDIDKLGTNWHIAAVEDFTGDGKADVLWNSDAGSVKLWEMNGAKIVSSDSVRSLNDNWVIADAGDFSGNGKADILLRNEETGAVAIRLMDGNVVTTSRTLDEKKIGLDWQVAGIGDFNGDGNDDILWRNDDGRSRIWQMDGTNVVSDKFVANGQSNAWDFATIGDYDNDGRDDVMWQNASGSTLMWEMDGSVIVDKHTIGTSLGADWHIV